MRFPRREVHVYANRCMIKVDDFAADAALLVENRDWSLSGAGLLGARADSSQLVNPPDSGVPPFLPTGR
jgi:hypothetical protein